MAVVRMLKVDQFWYTVQLRALIIWQVSIKKKHQNCAFQDFYILGTKTTVMNQLDFNYL